MTFKKIFWAICIGISLIVIITAVSWTPYGDINLKNTFQIINATNISASFLSGNLTWNDLYGYPIACPTYSAVTQLNDSVTCTDSWVHRDGDTMTGNLSVNGNVTADNVWIPTYIFAYTNNTINVAVPGDWYNVTFDEEEYDMANGITHTYNDATNNSFYITQNGIYEVLGTISIIDTSVVAEDHIMVYRMIKNGVEIHGSIWEGDFSRVDAASKRNFNIIVECSVGDSLGLQFTGTDTDIKLFPRDSTGYGDHHAHSASIKIKRIG